MTLCQRITSLIQDDDEHGSNIWPNKAMWNDSLNVPGNGATKWVTAPEDYDDVYNYLKVVRDKFVNILCSI